jgi:hypothetical protein
MDREDLLVDIAKRAAALQRLVKEFNLAQAAADDDHEMVRAFLEGITHWTRMNALGDDLRESGVIDHETPRAFLDELAPWTVAQTHAFLIGAQFADLLDKLAFGSEAATRQAPTHSVRLTDREGNLVGRHEEKTMELAFEDRSRTTGTV